VVEAKFFLELLMRLFANPPGLDGRGELLERGLGRQVRCIVFLLSCRAPLANKPHLIAGHGLDAVIAHTMAVPVGDPNTACRK
jgi:hypothetical protein